MKVHGDVFGILGLSPAGARIIRYYLVRPEARPHARALQRTLDLGGASLQRELDRMVELGALRKEREGRRTHYAAVEGAPVWRALRLLESSSSDPSPLLRDALVDVPGIRAAFVFGSVATGEHAEDSDIDVMIVEEADVDRCTLLRRLSEVGLLLGREVSAVRYTPQALAERLGDPEHPAWKFVRDVLTGPKRWIAGAAPALAPIVAAAGLATEALMGAEG